MAILLCESIIQNEHFDPSHFAYVIGEWMRRIDEGVEPARGAGKTISLAGRRLYKGTYWKRSGEFSAGNAPVVRVPPLAMFLCKKPEDQLIRDSGESSVPTHIDPLAIACTQVFSLAICRLLHADPDKFSPVDFANGLVEAARELNPHVAEVIESLAPRLVGHEIEEIAFVVPGGPRELTHFDRSIYLEEDLKEIVSMEPASLCCRACRRRFSAS